MIVLVEVAVGLTAIIAGFGFRHTYIVSTDVHAKFSQGFIQDFLLGGGGGGTHGNPCKPHPLPFPRHVISYTGL